MAKAGYKQGAFSATDAVHQLQKASGKCDFKWMKAHAASARFFGAREAEVKKALARCPSKRSGMMGVGDIDPNALPVGFWYGKPSALEVREHNGAYHVVLTAHDGTQLVREVGTPHATERLARADQKKRAKQLNRGNVKALDGARGVRGTPVEHAAQSNKHLEAAREELEWLLYGKPKRDPKTRRKIVRKIRRHIDQGASECSWTRGEAKARCEDEVRRLDAELAREGMGAVRSRGVPRGGCVYVVEAAGKKRKVTSDLASAKSAGKRMAKKGSAKITKACSRGRGSDSGTIVARCTSRGCS